MLFFHHILQNKLKKRGKGKEKEREKTNPQQKKCHYPKFELS